MIFEWYRPHSSTKEIGIIRIHSYIPKVLAAAATGASIAFAPAATASDQTCAIVGLSETECQTPGNVEINDTPPVQYGPPPLYLGDYGITWGFGRDHHGQNHGQNHHHR
jgi:hypothetical protein